MNKYLKKAIQSTKSLRSKIRQRTNKKGNQREDTLFPRRINGLYSTLLPQLNCFK